jgi:hypothetical protein
MRASGFCIGYHCNALHVTQFDADRVVATFGEDVETLRGRGLHVRYFSPHGGEASPAGQLTASFDHPSRVRHRLRWVCNGHSPRFDGYFSDGGIGPKLKSGDPIPDLDAFFDAMQPGRRYRALIHPLSYDFSR